MPNQTSGVSPALPQGERTFWCFISYRHGDNQTPGRQWATWLHQAIETYEVPPDLIGTVNERGDTIPERIFPVFRDEEELPVDADLASPIYRALDASRFLVVICSPRAVESTYVAAEIRYFKQLGRGDRVLAVMVAGEPNARWDEGKQKSGFKPEDECFPEPLGHAVDAEGNLLPDHTEPIAADFRLPDRAEGWTTPEAHRQALVREESLRRQDIEKEVKRYRERSELMKLKIIAGILGVPLGTLTQRDKAYQLAVAGKRQRIMLRIASALGALALIASAAGWYAWVARGGEKTARALAEDNARKAEEQKALAETNAEKAREEEGKAKNSAQVASDNATRAIEALANSDFREATNRLRQPERTNEALALLARAARTFSHKSAETRLWTLFQQRDFWTQVPASSPASAAPPAAAREADPRFATVDFKGQRLKPAWFSRSADGRLCVTVVNGDIVDGPIEVFHFRVWKQDGIPVTPWLTVSNPDEKDIRELSEAHLSPDGRYVAVVASVWREPAFIEIWDTQAKKTIGAKIFATGNSPHHQNAGFARVQFLTQSHRREFADGSLGAGHGLPLLLIASQRGDASVFAFSADELELLGENNHASGVVAANVDEKMEWLMSASDDRQVRVCDLTSNQLVGNPIDMPADVVSSERVEPNRLRVNMVESAPAEYRIWRPFAAAIPTPVQELPDGEFKVAGDGEETGSPNEIHYPPPGAVLATSPDGKQVVRLIKENELGLYDAGDDQAVTARWIHAFPSKIVDAKFVGKQAWLLVQTDAFVTEVWDVARGHRVGAPIEEARLFSEGETPARPLASILGLSEDMILTRSCFWDPPNLAVHWFTVWDLASGISILDRVRAEDDGSGDDEITRADLSEDGSLLLFGGEGNKPSRCLQLTPPAELRAQLADFAEALGGLKAEDGGSFSVVPSQRQKLEAFQSKLKSYEARINSLPPIP